MSCKIALADDDAISKETYADYLVELGHKVVTYSSGDELYLNLLSEAPDIVVADLQMPPGDWGGLWLIGEIRKADHRLPIIVLSEKGSPRQAAQAVEMGGPGFTSYVEKDRAQVDLPLAIQNLLRAVQQHSTAVENYTKRLEQFQFWPTLTLPARQALANGEYLYHSNVAIPGFDFSWVFGAFAKGMEIELRESVLKKLKQVSGSVHPLYIDGTKLDRYQGFSSTWDIITWLRQKDMDRHLQAVGVGISRKELIDFAGDLDFIRRERNPRIHGEIDERILDLERVRNKLLGIANQSIFVVMGRFK